MGFLHILHIDITRFYSYDRRDIFYKRISSVPKISVILPCYNVAPYIDVCLRSLTNQKLSDIEIICVDDKSTDDTLDIIQKHVKRDTRIKLIAQQKNQGVSAARNAGLDVATGEYIGFVDPDDYVDLDFYEKLYNTAKQEDADIVKADLVIVDVSGVRTCGRLNQRVKDDKLNFHFEFTSAIYRKEFLDKHNLRFLPDVSVGEDVNWQVKAAYLANKIPVIDDTAYMYIRRTDSAYCEMLSRSKIEKVCIAAMDLLDWTNAQENISYADYTNIMRFVYALLANNIKRCQTHHDKEHVCRHIIEAINRTRYKDDVLKTNFKKYSRSAIVRGDIHKTVLTLEYQTKRYKLFGIIPVVQEFYTPKKEYKIMLFDAIQLFRCRRGFHRDKFYIFGIPVLKITH